MKPKVMEIMQCKDYLVKHETVSTIKIGIGKNVQDPFKVK